MSLSLDRSSVEDLDLALRLYRRLAFRLVAILVLGTAAVIGLSHLSTALSPPYGVYILGFDLVSLGLMALLALLFLEFWWEGRAIGEALGGAGSPSPGIVSGLTVIAERARAMGMEWSGFLGPLRPIRKA